MYMYTYIHIERETYVDTYMYTRTAQEWKNRTLVDHEQFNV